MAIIVVSISLFKNKIQVVEKFVLLQWHLLSKSKTYWFTYKIKFNFFMSMPKTCKDMIKNDHRKIICVIET